MHCGDHHVLVGALQLLAENGVQFHFQTTAKEFVGESGKLKQVVLRDGTVLPAEFCVVGIGEISFTVLCYCFFGCHQMSLISATQEICQVAF